MYGLVFRSHLHLALVAHRGRVLRDDRFLLNAAIVVRFAGLKEPLWLGRAARKGHVVKVI